MRKPVRVRKPPSAAAGASARWRNGLFAVALVAAVFWAYQPACHGGFLWDDNAHVTRPELCSWHGLYRIWFDLRATQQYYPLLHSAFWLEHRLWGDSTLGYHCVNILLHAAAALLVALILRRLAVPGAYLAAAIFALHPVCVESVAWITEQKNTLSAVFYLGAMMAYLRFDQTRSLGTGPFFGEKTSLANQPLAENMDLSPSGGREARYYVAALGLFILALLSKTVTATLPAALLVIFWWQRGRLSWRRDVLPLVPFFILGLISGVFTAWVERKLIGAEGAAFELTIVERFLIAGRVVWFYLGKLFWPASLMFIYPRWKIDSAAWWQYLFPAAALVLVAALWLRRRRWRGPLAGVLFFVGTLFPVLGFFNVYPFIFSFVADHFQYLASLGIITLTSVGIVLWLTRWRLWNQPAGNVFCLALLAALATLTWRQSRMYADVETLYRTTIIANPDCAMAYTNLGIVLAERGQVGEAINLLQKSLELNPRGAEAHYNYGMALRRRGQLEEAIAEFQKALKLKPDYANAHNGLGIALVGSGQIDAGISHYRKVLEIEPDNEQAHYNLGNALAKQAKYDEAIREYQRALELDPDDANALNNLGNVLIDRGRIDEAIARFTAASRIAPENTQFSANLQDAWAQQNRLTGALARQRNLLRSRPADTVLLNNTAWMLATDPNASIRDGAEAVKLALRAVELSNSQDSSVLGTLAAAYAEAGRFPQAVETARNALELATQQNKPDVAELIKAKLALYEAGIPFRQTSVATGAAQP